MLAFSRVVTYFKLEFQSNERDDFTKIHFCLIYWGTEGYEQWKIKPQWNDFSYSKCGKRPCFELHRFCCKRRIDEMSA